MFYLHFVLSHLSSPYVVGIDAGGTSTRCAIVSLTGCVAGYGTGPGANRNSGGDPAAALRTALVCALGDVDPLNVIGGVFGIAGAGAAGRPAAVAAANTAWRSVGFGGAPHVVTDIAVAFAAATTAPAGVVVFAGTGAGAAVINNGAIVRRADGYGWLVGDEGSAVWLGREAVRAALAAYDGRGGATTLTRSVPRLLMGPDAADELMAGLRLPVSSRSKLPQAILKEVYGHPPAALGKLAPLVSEAAAAGDPVAVRIVEEAAHWLLTDVDAVRPALATLPPADPAGTPNGYGVVVAGSLLGRGPVAEAVRAGLRDRFGTDPETAVDGTRGAARLALRRLNVELI
jgi:glucosamine kinase